MTGEPAVEISVLGLSDAHQLAPLLAHYVQALKRGAPRNPDDLYAETLLQDPAAQVLGARIDHRLVGFALFHDLPDPVTGLRLGQVDHLYVEHEFRSRGIARAMIDLIADQAEDRGWARLVLNAPRHPEDGRKLYEQIAAPADWTAHVIRFEPK